jgi:predicted metal-dependent peptidase
MLLDPKSLVSESKLEYLDKKLSIAKSILSKFPKDGGMPFVYSFTATKKHYLSDDFPSRSKSPTPDNKEAVADKLAGTASTNGKRYNWHPDFLNMLSVQEIIYVMVHETYHIIMQHCNGTRCFGRNPLIWNLAVDYVVNYSIEHDFRIGNEKENNQFIRDCDDAYLNKEKIHPIWKGNLGTPYTLKELLVDIEESLKNKDNPDYKSDKEGQRVTYVDYSLYGRSPESIYDEIMDTIKKNGGGGDLNDLLGKMNIFNGMDAHETSDIDKHKLFEEILSATTTTRKMRGTLPGCIEGELKRLENPKLKWEDIARQSMQNIRQEKGSKNDWSRLRRRAMALDLYRPKKKDQFIRWLCMLDTSSSMSDEDIVYGISQLKVLDSRSEGIVVPCDAQVYWDKQVKIKNLNDLPKIKVVGRGGTVFDEFFNDYRKHIKEQIDLIIVITDGGVYLNCKRPSVDTVFVITNDHMPNFPWGRVAPLRTY